MTLLGHQMSITPGGLHRRTFWSVFEQSRIPMALVNENRCYVAINDAAVEMFRYRREDVIGALAGRTTADPDPTKDNAQWKQLLLTNELYAERVVEHSSGAPMRVSYAAHSTSIDGQWMALIVALSAHVEPDGVELIGTAEPDTSSTLGKMLTPREREVVRCLALGQCTRQIAADLHLSPATVATHVRNAMVKTDAHTRAQLVAIVLGDGLIGH